MKVGISLLIFKQTNKQNSSEGLNTQIIIAHAVGGEPEAEPRELTSWKGEIFTMSHLSGQQYLEELCIYPSTKNQIAGL